MHTSSRCFANQLDRPFFLVICSRIYVYFVAMCWQVLVKKIWCLMLLPWTFICLGKLSFCLSYHLHLKSHLPLRATPKVMYKCCQFVLIYIMYNNGQTFTESLILALLTYLIVLKKIIASQIDGVMYLTGCTWKKWIQSQSKSDYIFAWFRLGDDAVRKQSDLTEVYGRSFVSRCTAYR